MTSWRTTSRYIDKMADDRSKDKNIVNHLQNLPENRIQAVIEAIDGEPDIPENRIQAVIEGIEGESDIPENRVQAVIEAIDVESGGEDTSTGPLSQSPSTEASPRPAPSRRLRVNDVAYLSTREFARVLGLTLEQFDGNTVRPLANEAVEVDLFWNRQHRTLGIRTVTSTGEIVGENHITPLLEGRTTSEVTQSPSALLVVTNGTFSDQAEQIAENNDIGLFDGGHLKQWFHRALIPFDAVGAVLEEGENHDGPLEELVALPTPPEPRCGVDPLELERVSEVQTETTDDKAGITREELLEQLRSLHDRLDRLPETGDLQDVSGIHQNDYVGNFGGWDEALKAAGIDKEQVLLDDIERVAEKVGGVPSAVDMDEHGTYSADYYQSCFGSWSAALKQSVVRESYDSGSDDGDSGSDSNDREAMLETIRELHEQLGRVPKTTELPEEYTPNHFYEEFGGWDTALEAAGIDKEQAILKDIERVAQKVERVPTTTDMQEHHPYPASAYSSYFDSWDEALERSGVKQRFEEKSAPQESRSREISEESETQKEMLKTWSDVLEQSGVKESYNSGSDNPNQKSATSTDEVEITATEGSCNQDKILTEIAKVQRIVHREPTRDDFKTNANIPISAVDEQFDSWKTAVNAAMASEQKHGTSSEGTTTGTDSTDPTATETPRNNSGRDKKSQYTPEGVLDEIRRVAVKLGRTPLVSDMQEHANISIDTVRETFDTWARARKEAGVDEITEARLSELRESYNSGSRRGISDVTSEESGDGALLPPDTSVDEIDDYVAGVGPTSIYAIKKAGYKTLGELHDATPEEVTECKGIGRAKARKVIQFVTENVSALQDDRSVPVNDEQSSPGKKGVLYADPDEDGDYQMFDNYLEEL